MGRRGKRKNCFRKKKKKKERYCTRNVARATLLPLLYTAAAESRASPSDTRAPSTQPPTPRTPSTAARDPTTRSRTHTIGKALIHTNGKAHTHTHTTYRRRALPSLLPAHSNHPRRQISRPCLTRAHTCKSGRVRAIYYCALHAPPGNRPITDGRTTLWKFVLTPPRDVNQRTPQHSRLQCVRVVAALIWLQ